jgi:hypothetical protein
MKTEKELEIELEVAREKDNTAFHNAPLGMDFKQFEEWMKPTSLELSRISRELRMIKTPKFDFIPDYGDVMLLSEFVDNVKGGGFIDYDGFGKYCRGDMMSDIEIYPSDVKHNKIRTDFDKIVWFNR